MLGPAEVADLLRAEISADDPWRLSTNPFERRRYGLLLDMIDAPGRAFERGLEVGCAAGVFTELLAPRCRALHVIDVVPTAIARASARLAARRDIATRITWEVGSVTQNFAPGRNFDLIVVAEILCLLPSAEAVGRAVEALAARLEPGGLLVFGSPADETCRRWELSGPGAETTMIEWRRHLREVGRASCVGEHWSENSRIAAYTRAAAGEPPDALPNVAADPARGELAAAQREAQRLQRAVLEREAELAAMRASTSWKLTAPLRRLKRLLGG